jgi:protein-tyrosine-phosphatase
MDHDLAARLSALAHPQRLAVFRLLVRRYPDRVAAGEIGAALGARPSTLSAWLSDLTEAGLIDFERRATSLLYRARLGAVQGLVADLSFGACRGRALPELPARTGRVRNVLFLGAGNAGRSLMAEALLRDLAGAGFEAFSAGAAPAEAPSPQALAMLAELGHDTAPLWSKPLEGFAAQGAPRMDAVITLADAVANADLPRWPGAPVQTHWGLPDPVALGTAEGYAACYLTLRARIERLARLPAGLGRDALQDALDELASLRAEPD